MNEPIIDEDELKSIGSSSVVTDGDDLIEDAMDDLAQLDKDLDGSSSSDLWNFFNERSLKLICYYFN